MIKVVLNPWLGGGTLKPGVLCHVCGRPQTVAQIQTFDKRLLYQICATCLARAKEAIHQAVITGLKG